MTRNFFQKSLNVLLRRQTNILSAAFVIMATVIFSQILGLFRQRLLVDIFKASEILGVYLAATKIPDFLFQIIIAGALSSSFIPVFSDFLTKGKNKEAHILASTLLTCGLLIFFVLSVIIFIFTPFFLKVINLGSGYSAEEMVLMASLTRIIIIGQMVFIIGTFFSALLQSYDHFFIPGIAAALYNLGIIIGILSLSRFIGIFAPAWGIVLGAFIFIAVQIPMIRKVGFIYTPSISLQIPGVLEVLRLMWPRTISIAIFQVGILATIAIISFLPNTGRYFVIFDYAQTLAFAPIVLFGQTIAQAAFPVLSRERERLEDFKLTFMTSFTQMLYLVLPVSALFIILRIPLVRLAFGAPGFDWNATVLTGRTLAFFSVSIFAQALIYLVSRGFYALHDTKTPLLVGSVTTIITLVLLVIFIVHLNLGIGSAAIAYSIASIINLVVSMILLDKKIGGFKKSVLIISTGKIVLATFFTGFALYIPIKLLDKLVFDTTRTINLIFLSGISGIAGICLYIFLTWFFNVKEASTFILMFKKVGNWKEILGGSQEVIDGSRSQI